MAHPPTLSSALHRLSVRAVRTTLCGVYFWSDRDSDWDTTVKAADVAWNARTYAGFGSFGNPSARSPTMLRWISAAPPQMVSEREKKYSDWMLSTG